MSDLHDLDRAFDALASDLASHPGRPGAGAAIQAARRRRRTRIAGGAAMMALVLAVITVPMLGGGGTGRADLASPSDLPLAAPLDVAALTAATAGWMGPWEVLDAENASRFNGIGGASCLAQQAEDPTEPVRTGDRLLVAGASDVAFAAFAEFADPSASSASYATVVEQFDACAGVASETSYGDGLVTHLALPAAGKKQPPADLWVGRIGDRLGMLTLAGAESAAPADNLDRVAAALLSALQVDESFELSDTRTFEWEASEPAAAPHDVFPPLGPTDIAAVAPGWSPRWEARSDRVAVELPCLASWPESSGWGQGSSFGERGTLSYNGLDDADSGREALVDLSRKLSDCSSVKWTMHLTFANGGSNSMWASSSAGTIFAAQRDNVVVDLKVVDPAVPTEADATAVLALLGSNLAAATISSEAPSQRP